MPHKHYYIEVSSAFRGVLGILQAAGSPRRTIPTISGSTVDQVVFGGRRHLSTDERESLKGKRRFSHNDSALQLIDATWSGYTQSQKALFHALQDEKTLEARGTGRGQPAPRQYVTATDKTAGHREYCPYLIPGIEYVRFGGNGRRPGYGYRIGGSWLKRAQYLVNRGRGGSREALREFVADLERVVAERMGGVIGCYVVGEWRDLAWLKNLSAGPRLRDALDVCVIPHAPLNYEERLLKDLRDRGNFSVIPRSKVELQQANTKKLLGAGGHCHIQLFAAPATSIMTGLSD